MPAEILVLSNHLPRIIGAVRSASKALFCGLRRFMGEKARRKRQFLAENPFCCFCGGGNPATTEDHVPHRALFTGRRWPEGYVFPACENCNSNTRLAEQVVNFLSRCYQDPFGRQEETEFNRALDALGNNHPGIIKEILPVRSLSVRILIV
jgi:hypothetical protein